MILRRLLTRKPAASDAPPPPSVPARPCYAVGDLHGRSDLLDAMLRAIAADAAGIEIEQVHVDGPMGVRGRNSDNSKLREVLDWEPKIALEEGLARTYRWIEDQLREKLAREEREAELKASAQEPAAVA